MTFESTRRRKSRSRRRVRFFSLLCAGILLLPPLLPPAAASEPSLEFVALSTGGYRITGRFHFNGSLETAWAVVSDYDHIDAFVSTLLKSEVLERRDGRSLMEQEAAGRFLLIFSRKIRVRLLVRERPPERIDFEDISGKDFKRYRGSWELRPGGRGVAVIYRLRVEPAFHLPRSVAARVFSKNARSLLEEVLEEMSRRERLRDSPPNLLD